MNLKKILIFMAFFSHSNAGEKHDLFSVEMNNMNVLELCSFEKYSDNINDYTDEIYLDNI